MIKEFFDNYSNNLRGDKTIANSSILSASDYVAHTTSPLKAGWKQWIQKPRDRRSYIATRASILLLLALLAGSVTLLILYLPATTATVTITPMSTRITHTYPITLVTGNPTGGQIKEHVISYTTSPQSQTVPVTGKGHHDATKAQVQVVISQIHHFDASDHNRPTIRSNVTANDGTMIMIDSFIATDGATITVNAAATNAGGGGNIPAYNIDGEYDLFEVNELGVQGRQTGTAYIQNPSAFTGGLDASDYTYVQQQDIDAVVNPLSAQLTPSARQQAQQGLQSGEQLVQDLTCTNSVNIDHKVQETADSVTVTVQITCSGIAYNKQDLLTAAINAQKAAASIQLGTGYLLSGDIITGTPSLNKSSKDGPVVYEVPTNGLWVFQIDKALQHEMAHSIAGRPLRDATDQLLQRKGIKTVEITTAGSIRTALPTSPERIKFVIIVPKI